MPSQTMTVAASPTTNWAECMGNGGSPTTGTSLRANAGTTAANARTMAMLFTAGTAIPAGSTIDAATLRMDPVNVVSDDANLRIYYEAAVNPATFNTTTRTPEALSRSTASVELVQTGFASGGGYGEVHITTLLQDRVATLGGIDEGHTLALILRGRQDAVAGQVFSINQPSGAQGPELVVEWTAPEASSSPARSRMSLGIGIGIGLGC